MTPDGRPPDADAALLIVTDIDGTLLDDSHQLPCTPRQLHARLDELRASRKEARSGAMSVAMASSRTLRELLVLQRATALYGPCIAEDGALLALDAQQPQVGRCDAPARTEHVGSRQLHVWEHATAASRIREDFADIPCVARADAALQNRGQLAELGFSTLAKIRRALVNRHHSVLLVPELMSISEQRQLRDTADARGFQLRRGGRWLTLAASGGKGPALRALRRKLNQNVVQSLTVAAIGNEENDVTLLAEADLRFVIRNPGRGPHPALAALPGAIVLDSEGIGGWMEMLDILQGVKRLAPATGGMR